MNKKEALKIVQQAEYKFKDISSDFKKDRNFVLEAVKLNGLILGWVGKKFSRDKEIVLEAVKENGYTLRNADENLKKDKDIVLEAVKESGSALQFSDKILRKDKKIVLEALKNNNHHFFNAFDYVDISLKKDADVIKVPKWIDTQTRKEIEIEEDEKI